MPEMRFHVLWPDGSRDSCYSPSLVIKDYLAPGQRYPVDGFVEKAAEALMVASDRVKARYGFPCSLALGQLRAIRCKATIDRSRPRLARLGGYQPGGIRPTRAVERTAGCGSVAEGPGAAPMLGTLPRGYGTPLDS